MNPLKLIGLFILVCLSGSLLAADQGDSLPKIACVRVVPESDDIQDYSFYSPGRYCVDQDFYLQSGFALSEGWRESVPSDVMLAIYSGDVVVDLQGHEIKTNSNRVNGVLAYPDQFHPKPLNRIVIRNGVIDLRGGFGVSLTSQNVYELDKLKNRVLELAGQAHQAADRYLPSNYVLENLTIKTSGQGIILVGKNSIVRNCKIDAGDGGVHIYGPGAQVVNNEIVLHSAESNPHRYPYSKKPPIALILHDAEGAVVSGNTITVKGNMKSAQAIVLSRSPNVRIENNKINGVAQAYVIDDAPTPLDPDRNPENYAPLRESGPTSSATLKDNVVNPSRGWFSF